MAIRSLYLALNLAGLMSAATLAAVSSATMGIHGFDLNVDIGSVRHPGGAAYNVSPRVYSIRGSGSNMWFGADAFHFLGKKVSGDFSMAAAVEWPQAGEQPHRKAGLMLRQSPDASSPYVDAVIHGDGLTSLQFREVPGGPTREIQAAVKRPLRLRLERWGAVISMSVMVTNGIWQPSGCVVRLALADPVYAGLFVCAHADQAVEEARFAHVQWVEQPLANLSPTNNLSVAEVVPLASLDRRVLMASADLLEGPVFAGDGKHIQFHRQGKQWRIPILGGPLELINQEPADMALLERAQSPDRQWKLQITSESSVPPLMDLYHYQSVVLSSLSGRAEPRKLAQLLATKRQTATASWSPDNRSLTWVSYPPDITRCLAVRDRWEKEILAYEAGDETNPPPAQAILFLGSSTMRLWRTLTQDFPGLPVFGRGFGGSHIADSLYHADRLVFPYQPKKIVLYAGDNDLAAHQSPDRVVADFAALAKAIQRSLPETRLTFLAIKPSFARWALLAKIQRANQLVAEFCQTHPGCEFVDTFTPTLGPDGQPRRDWFESDGLHLNRAGYAGWAVVIRPFLLAGEKDGENGRK